MGRPSHIAFLESRIELRITDVALGFGSVVPGAPVPDGLEGGNQSGIALVAERLGDAVPVAKPQGLHQTRVTEWALGLGNLVFFTEVGDSLGVLGVF
jgi:hypothetical protein